MPNFYKINIPSGRRVAVRNSRQSLATGVNISEIIESIFLLSLDGDDTTEYMYILNYSDESINTNYSVDFNENKLRVHSQKDINTNCYFIAKKIDSENGNSYPTNDPNSYKVVDTILTKYNGMSLNKLKYMFFKVSRTSTFYNSDSFDKSLYRDSYYYYYYIQDILENPILSFNNKSELETFLRQNFVTIDGNQNEIDHLMDKNLIYQLNGSDYIENLYISTGMEIDDLPQTIAGKLYLVGNVLISNGFREEYFNGLFNKLYIRNVLVDSANYYKFVFPFNNYVLSNRSRHVSGRGKMHIHNFYKQIVLDYNQLYYECIRVHKDAPIIMTNEPINIYEGSFEDEDFNIPLNVDNTYFIILETTSLSNNSDNVVNYSLAVIQNCENLVCSHLDLGDDNIYTYKLKVISLGLTSETELEVSNSSDKLVRIYIGEDQSTIDRYILVDLIRWKNVYITNGEINLNQTNDHIKSVEYNNNVIFLYSILQ